MMFAPAPLRSITMTPVGTLGLDQPDEHGRRFLGAASGIVAGPVPRNDTARTLWAVSDDTRSTYRFSAVSLTANGHGFGTLPDRAATKLGKYDLEAVAVYHDGVVISAPSGSKPGRDVGTAIQMMDGSVVTTRPVRFTLLYERFAAELGGAKLNVEGLAVRDAATGVELLFFHRGTSRKDPSRVFVTDMRTVLAAMSKYEPAPASAFRSSHAVQLGELGGAPLGISDAKVLDDGRILVAATAEGRGTEREGGAGSGDSVDDDALGVIVGSAIGLLDASFALRSITPVAAPSGEPVKLEGIELARRVDPSAPAGRVLLVDDPDDAARPSRLFTADLDL